MNTFLKSFLRFALFSLGKKKYKSWQDEDAVGVPKIFWIDFTKKEIYQ